MADERIRERNAQLNDANLEKSSDCSYSITQNNSQPGGQRSSTLGINCSTSGVNGSPGTTESLN